MYRPLSAVPRAIGRSYVEVAKEALVAIASAEWFMCGVEASWRVFLPPEPLAVSQRPWVQLLCEEAACWIEEDPVTLPVLVVANLEAIARPIRAQRARVV